MLSMEETEEEEEESSEPPVPPMSPPVAQLLRQPIGNRLAQPPEQLRQSNVRLVVEGLEECL